MIMMDLPKYHPTRKETCCESSLMFNVRFRRCKLLNQVLPALALLSVFANVYLVANRKKYIVPSLNDGISPRQLESILEISEPEPIVINEELRHLIKSNEQIMNLEIEAKKKRRHFGPKLLTPQPPALDNNTTFSACLLIKDDNAILSEWIAYHYHTLNLRHLVVAVDPNSAEAPDIILNRWRHHTDMKIFQWKDSDYMPQSFLDNEYLPDEYLQDESDFEGMSSNAYVDCNVHFSMMLFHLSKTTHQFAFYLHTQNTRNFTPPVSSTCFFS
jgi:hypothetical protein